ncbi:hypothetical protein [Roseateles depolymerans]|uniref:hypothetical protein n=1 Tax=Roseateles depolymerans TaxID=76731 RepID=UPI0011C0263F|nr:hypothetical protein [Roseateles depolymerans]
MKNFSYSDIHDALIHGISFKVEDWVSELHLDIDVPISTIESAHRCRFLVAKANLRFENVTDLVVHVDWGGSGYSQAVSGPFVVEISREPVESMIRTPQYYKWMLRMADQKSFISLGASQANLVVGEPVEVDRQYLFANERI